MERVHFKFEKMIVWQKAVELGEDFFALTVKFPNNEKFNLTSQMRRAVDSIALNISEGSIGQSNLDLRKFIGYSIRSLAEAVTCMHKARNRTYLSNQEFDKHYKASFNLMNQLIAFKKSIK